MRLIKSTLLAAAVCAGCLSAAVTTAQAAEADVLYRQENMKAIGAHMKSIVALIKGEVAHADQLTGHAQGLAATAAMAPAAFKTQAMEGKTTATEAVWANWDKFEGGLKMMREEAEKLATIAAAGDMAAAGAQLGALGKTCKGCHDDFRKKD